MSVRKEDYRTNKADYVIAATYGRMAADDDERDEPMAKEKFLQLRDRRFAKLAANPAESSPGPKARPRGYGHSF
ncbi:MULTISPECIES: hypothetical protein [Mesorhizobium]|jgi:hypothetical protein|uniref:Uncharacterized protein n=1 Tax=Mesorhizobium opportunistum (strain LMG 24607 / HAMBI 3007 / WSM2075) TaxID=536019 RepID=F7Y805_MESOW|nr:MULTISPECIES: hypothetical protein [Mesorhizobium]AEH86387.1 hypothetical protein Mesop_1906 [Mesorhizobium opportunistum WSM2075]MCA0031561.1 hypothetical protein [Mesorhizobium sp. B263B2A]TPN55018.1 hypothetical protein FJ978_05895 [Mesorhizobium sp. B1-1-7]TPN55503.1 hypothetical protein FJ976_07980 [Mesorhizobium sp. B1-1-9]